MNTQALQVLLSDFLSYLRLASPFTTCFQVVFDGNVKSQSNEDLFSAQQFSQPLELRKDFHKHEEEVNLNESEIKPVFLFI